MDVSSLVASIAGAAQLTKLLVDERDRQKTAAIQIDLSNKIAEAQIQLTQVLSSIIEKDGLIQTLSERVRELEADQNERSRYQLRKLGTIGDFFAYQLRPAAELSERSDEPPHFLCQPCLDIRKHKSVLRLTEYTAKCNACGISHAIQVRPHNGIIGGGDWMGK